MSYLVGALAAILSFGFIIFIHELGHFMAARWAGIRCPQFAIGFGPKLWGFRRHGTDFSLRILPLGGYVLMVGEDPGSDGGESWHAIFSQAVGEVEFPTTPQRVLSQLREPNPEVEEFLQSLPPQRLIHTMADLEGNFHGKSTWQRTVVILGGVVMNYSAAVILLMGLSLGVGLCSPQPKLVARAARIIAGSPAEKAGLKADETLIRLNGMEVLGSADFRTLIGSEAGRETVIQVRSEAGAEREVKVVPDLLLAGNYVARQGSALEIVRCDKDLPASIKLPYTITSVNGKALSRLEELTALAQKEKELTLGGPQGEWKLQSEKGLAPRGVMGVELADVLSFFTFEKQNTPEIVEVVAGSPAEKAGLRAGDILIGLQGADVGGGKTIIDAALLRLSQRTLKPGMKLLAEVVRGQQLVELTFDQVPAGDSQAWGLKLQPIGTAQAAQHTGRIMLRIASVPLEIARGLFRDTKGTVKELKEQSQGPIGIMQTIWEVSGQGLPELLFLVGILNAFIATFNLMPIPALDGSRCLFIWLGALRGKAFDPEKEARIHFIGIVLLLGLSVVVGFNDVQKAIHGVSSLK